jgi:hypothetical protein
MNESDAGVTAGDIKKAIAPLFADMSPKDINHVVVIAVDNGELRTIGCEHGALIAKMMVSLNEGNFPFHTRPRNVGYGNTSRRSKSRPCNWLESLLREL